MLSRKLNSCFSRCAHIFSINNNISVIFLTFLDFHNWRHKRHYYGNFDAELVAMVTDGLRVVAKRRRYYADALLFFGEHDECVSRSPFFKTEDKILLGIVNEMIDFFLFYLPVCCRKSFFRYVSTPVTADRCDF